MWLKKYYFISQKSSNFAAEINWVGYIIPVLRKKQLKNN